MDLLGTEPRERTIYIGEILLWDNSVIYAQKRPIYIQKSKHSKKGIQRRSPGRERLGGYILGTVYAQKRPVYTQQRPTYTQKRPVYTQKSIDSKEGSVYTQKSPVYTRRDTPLGQLSYIRSKETYIYSKEFYINLKEPCIHSNADTLRYTLIVFTYIHVHEYVYI